MVLGEGVKDLTLVLPHYQNHGMWLEQQKVWADYPKALLSRLHVVLVDDCSPKAERPTRKSVTVDGLASLRIYRLLEHKRWNWLACRNLGAKMASDGWMLLTDIDHVMPAQTMGALMQAELDTRCAYRFNRVDAPRRWPYHVHDCKPYKPHNDTWLMTRDLFFSKGVFGYDERLSGCYGTSGEFKDRVFATARSVTRLDSVVIRYPREIIPDASTHPSVYTRKNDPVNDKELEVRKAQRDLVKGWKPLHGLIEYEEVYSSLGVEVPC